MRNLVAMVAVAGLSLLVSACFHPSYDHTACGPNGECPGDRRCNTTAQICEPAGSEAPGPDAPGPDACTTFSSQFDTCAIGFDTDLTLTGTNLVYDTATGQLTGGPPSMPIKHMTIPTRGETPVDAIIARTVRLTAGSKLHAVGPLPLAIAASEIVLEDGASIDVNAGGAGMVTACSSAPGPGVSGTDGAGGGGGGGYSAQGGNGGPGANGGSPGGAGGTSISVPLGLQGGCSGAKGGNGNVSGDGGAGGAGGGALYLVARAGIELGDKANVLACGGGGLGGKQAGGGAGEAGGGGGGSGGMIFLEAPQLVGPTAVVAANGGGGGEGSDNRAAGRDGESGRASTSRASGGTDGVDDGGDGGRGGSRDAPAGESVEATVSAGGGGGGGGVGYIVILSPATPMLGTVSPPSRGPHPATLR